MPLLQALFYTMLTPFLAFFGSFAAFIYPMRDVLHPNQLADWLLTVAPAGFAAPIGCLRNWTYSLFYLLANMWGSVVVSLMFWGFANEITTVRAWRRDSITAHTCAHMRTHAHT